ncbi:MAG: tetratricopeptide repeat protein [Pseudomonadota bacterium]
MTSVTPGLRGSAHERLCAARRSGLATCAALLLSLTGCGGSDGVDNSLDAADDAIANEAFDAASLQLTNALQAQPGNAEIRARLAQVALIAGRASVAERQARAIARMDNDPSRGDRLLCDALLARGEFDAVLDEFGQTRTTLGQTCRAKAHLHRGDLADAAQLFNEVSSASPSVIEAQLGLAAVEQAKGDFARAERRLRRVVATEPNSIAAHAQLAGVLVALNRLDEARLTLRDTVALPRNLDNYPQWIEARVALAEVEWRLGNEREAIAALDKLLSAYPSHPLPKYLRALLAYENADYRLAREYLRNVLNLVPNHVPSQKLSTAADLAQGQFGRSQLPLIESGGSDASDPLMTELQSRIYLGMGNANEAVATMSSLNRSAWPDGAQRHLARAMTLSGKFTDAAQLYDFLLRQPAADTPLSIHAVANLLHGGQVDEADKIMSEWPVTDQTQRARTTLRLLRFLRAGDLRRAEELAKRRRRDDPSDLTAFLALAEVAERQGRRDDAVQWLEMAIERNPEAVEPRLLMASYARRRSDHQSMQTLSDGILAQQPYNASALALQGEASLLRGDSYAAIDTLREAIRVSPSTTEVAIALVRAQLASGDFWQARRDIKGALLRNALPPETVAALAIEEHRRGNSEQARALSDDLTGLDRTKAAGLELQGDLYLLQGNYGRATSSYERAYIEDPSRGMSFKAAIAAHAAGRRPGDAIDSWLASRPGDRQMKNVRDAIGASL